MHGALGGEMHGALGGEMHGDNSGIESVGFS